MNQARPAGADAGGIAAIAAVSAGMVLFAWCSHQRLPWGAVGAGGLLLTAIALVWSPFGDVSPASVLGLEPFTVKAAAFAVAGVLLGIGAGLAHRQSIGMPMWSWQHTEPFVAVACLIGAAEEVLYRGWLLGRARRLGWPAAIVVAAVAHAAYKTALFAWPSAPSPVDLLSLAMLTTAGGMLLGALRWASGSLLPAVLAHAAFDFVVYRAVGHAPWWVWS